MSTQTSRTTQRRNSFLLAGWFFLVTGLTLWPFWKGLYTTNPHHVFMLRDMFIAQDMALNSSARGTAMGAPRNLPQDTIFGIITPEIPGVALASFLVLLCAFTGCWHATLMVRNMAGGGLAPQMAASLFVIWNPFTIERFLQGQWTIATAAFLMPVLAYSIADRRWGSWLLGFAGSALVPTGALLAVITSLTFARGIRDRGITLITGAFMSSPWILAILLNPHGASGSLSSPRSAELFAARAEEGIGTLGALLSLGGIWNADAEAPSRTLLPTIVGLVLVLVLLLGMRELWRVYRPVAVMTVVAILLPAAFATPWGLEFMGWLVSTVPGAGLLRDTQKFVCLAIPGYVLLIGVFVGKFGEASVGRAWASSLIIMMATVISVPCFPRDIAPLSTQPISPVWDRIMTAVDAAPPGKILMFPPGNYHQRGEYPSISPAMKLLSGEPLDPGFLIVDGRLVDGQPEVMGLLKAVIDGGDDVHKRLADADVSWVLLDTASDAGREAVSAAKETMFEAGYPLILAADGYLLFRVSHAGAAGVGPAVSSGSAGSAGSSGSVASGASGAAHAAASHAGDAPESERPHPSTLPAPVGLIMFWSATVLGLGLRIQHFALRWVRRK
ncbi:hypothetical protein GC425_08670 [Corynebacterium sp. zg254]|uniref:Glycosyltransferase RgtA/B/C/D-like domain-containing protein n=1 Tax=Corynebacterium zhongnanshanii TaxID=2768834 RepID=A0ABQ6VCM1_9CORY|nr:MULTISPECIES: hypothetical protein [Corynebacterium]KAB3519974.1 hypothetical protein F8377_08710 [Corynebacterium zhongnanshanii]MCR5914923.1 hypothetical protein [Corynebacterium sp. zg254]